MSVVGTGRLLCAQKASAYQLERWRLRACAPPSACDGGMRSRQASLRLFPCQSLSVATSLIRRERRWLSPERFSPVLLNPPTLLLCERRLRRGHPLLANVGLRLRQLWAARVRLLGEKLEQPRLGLRPVIASGGPSPGRRVHGTSVSSRPQTDTQLEPFHATHLDPTSFENASWSFSCLNRLGCISSVEKSQLLHESFHCHAIFFCCDNRRAGRYSECGHRGAAKSGLTLSRADCPKHMDTGSSLAGRSWRARALDIMLRALVSRAASRRLGRLDGGWACTISSRQYSADAAEGLHVCIVGSGPAGFYMADRVSTRE